MHERISEPVTPMVSLDDMKCREITGDLSQADLIVCRAEHRQQTVQMDHPSLICRIGVDGHLSCF